MAQFICPGCGSKYFQTSKAGAKNTFIVVGRRTVEFIQQAGDVEIDTKSICCGACSWQGALDELVESRLD
ncbi:hypothetical protein [Desulforhopalus sp. 52FAK]